MICGSAEAESRKYKKYEDKEGNVWLVAIQEAAGENIYVHNPKDKNSQGFAGRTIHFELEDGTIYSAQGPWHSNADSLFSNTGVDVRATFKTFVVLAKERLKLTDGTWRCAFKGIVYKDEKPTLGLFNRYKDLIKQYPEANYYFSGSSGGSSSGPIHESDRQPSKP